MRLGFVVKGVADALGLVAVDGFVGLGAALVGAAEGETAGIEALGEMVSIPFVGVAVVAAGLTGALGAGVAACETGLTARSRAALSAPTSVFFTMGDFLERGAVEAP